jgi:hypothetical protein
MSTETPHTASWRAHLAPFPWMSGWEKGVFIGGYAMGKSDEQDAHLGHPDIGCAGIVDGTGAPNLSGSYVKLVAVWPSEARQEMRISRGAAENLIAELQGALSRAAS